MSNITIDHTICHIATITPNWEPYDPKEKNFPPPIYHVPIGACVFDLHEQKDEAKTVKAVLRTKVIRTAEAEKPFIKGLINQLPGRRGSFVTFNGDTFLVPVLLYRAMAHNLPNMLPLLTTNTAAHINLYWLLGNYGRLYNVASLSEFGQLLGYPKRPYLDVAAAYENKAYDAIRSRLEIDVILITKVWLSLMVAFGSLNATRHDEVSDDINVALDAASDGAKAYLVEAGLREDDD